ncbi:MAG: hypothetical protein CVU38_11565 [Chloroflexi bacterium HGW-Chloroflexi-1]|nr:MAG: hypothetical protein CVU38_11565 [Chloroflexi bacterium HGW-Chloroflexi-1]
MFDPAAIQAAPAPPRGSNPFALLAQVWYRPGRTLCAVVAGPGWLWAIPLLLAVALILARVFGAAPLLAQEQKTQMLAMQEASMANMPAEYRESLPPEATQLPEPSAALTVGLPLIGGLGGILLGWLLRAGLLHVGCLALGGRQGFGVLYKASAWASLPLILRDGVQAAYMALAHELVKAPGLSGLLTSPPSSQEIASSMGVASGAVSQPATAASIVLGRVDLYTIWYVILLGLALMAASKLPRGKAALVVAGYALLSVLTGFGSLLTRGLTGGF